MSGHLQAEMTFFIPAYKRERRILDDISYNEPSASQVSDINLPAVI